MHSNTSYRQNFVDSARGISIGLVVLWHTFGDLLSFNGPLVFLRMPLFFFMAGLFATSLFTASTRDVLVNKIGQLAWIYVIWSSILYLSRSGIRDILINHRLDFYQLYSIGWIPPSTMWFIYALMIAYGFTFITASLPRLLVLAVTLSAYLWSASYGQWAEPPFLLKLLRLLPAFVLASAYSGKIILAARRYENAWPILFILFLASAFPVYHSELSRNGLATLSTSILGISAILTFCHKYQSHPIMKWLAYAGMNSIYIFVMHRIILSYASGAFEILGIHAGLLAKWLIFLLAILLPLTLGKWIVDRYFPYLIRAPWRQHVPRRPLAGMPPPAIAAEK